MGVNFVFIVENKAKRTQEEINKEFEVTELGDFSLTEWKLFTYEGKEYAYWTSPPRFFIIEEAIEEEPEKWEALRKYLVRVKNFFQSDEIYYTNDAVWCDLPEEPDKDPDFYIPRPLDEEYLQEPDYEKHPELKEVEELSGLVW